jgi:hypothetical protein
MPTDVMLTVGTILVGVITAIMVGFIPWAHRINTRLTRIEVRLELFTVHGPDDLREILGRIEKQMQAAK